MSLILDALKKLEREKQAGEPGVVVVGPVPWGERRARRLPALLGLVALVVAVVAGAGWLLRPAAPRSPASGLPAAEPSAAPASSAALPAREISPPPRPVQPPRAGETAPHPVPPPPRELDLPGRAPAAAAPEVVPAAPTTEIRLNAISVRDGKPIALLNDRLVREGDSFDGIRVLRIGESEVEVEVHGRRRVIRF